MKFQQVNVNIINLGFVKKDAIAAVREHFDIVQLTIISIIGHVMPAQVPLVSTFTQGGLSWVARALMDRQEVPYPQLMREVKQKDK